MNTDIFKDKSVGELVQGFAELCVAQDQALLYSDIPKLNRLIEQMRTVENELKIRPGDQRRALMDLYDHENAQVRLQAGQATLAVARETARKQIETIANGRKFPQAGDAGMVLDALDRGIFKPV
jgi:uncharacterized protein DUF2019